MPPNLLQVMKKFLPIFLLLAAFGFAGHAQKFDPDSLLKKKPYPPRLVNDLTNTLTPDQNQALENKLVVFDDSTSTQIAVVIVPTLYDIDIADYNIKLGRAWGVGGKQNNNGVILLIAKDDHKLNIATGYGLEGSLPDLTCKQIIDDIIVPKFKGEDYYRGIDEGTTAIMQAVKGIYTAPQGYHSRKSGRSAGRIILVIFLIILFLAMRGGGTGGSFMSRRGFAVWTIGNMLGGGGSGGWSGGGGGGSSGGFGGFGGGSFGGGGSSGSW